MRRHLVIGLAASLVGCASTPTPPAVIFPGAEAPTANDAFSRAACSAADAAIAELSVRIAGRDGREGFYARAELAAAAKERDELVRRLLERHRCLQACLPPSGVERDRALGDSRRLMDALLDGGSPTDVTRLVEVTDRRRPPQALPLFTRACEKPHGLEGALECFFLLSVPLITADIVTLPLGTWFWAGPDRDKRLTLRETYPPPADLVAEVDALSPPLRRAAPPAVAFGLSAKQPPKAAYRDTRR